MEIEIKATFFGGKGHCNVTIIPSDYATTKYASTKSFFFELNKGNYNLQLQGVSADMVLIQVLDPEEEIIAKKEIKKQGNFMRSLDVIIK